MKDQISKIIKDSHNDYMLANNDVEKEIMARHIARAASGFIKNTDSKIEDWLETFKDEEIVIFKLKQLENE